MTDAKSAERLAYLTIIVHDGINAALEELEDPDHREEKERIIKATDHISRMEEHSCYAMQHSEAVRRICADALANIVPANIREIHANRLIACAKDAYINCRQQAVIVSAFHYQTLKYRPVDREEATVLQTKANWAAEAAYEAFKTFHNAKEQVEIRTAIYTQGFRDGQNCGPLTQENTQ